MFIDSHAHIDGSEFDVDRLEVLARAKQAGIETILNVGTGDPHNGNLERAVEFGNNTEAVYTAIGIHPHDARHYDGGVERLVTRLASSNPKVIAWGEIGLDFHYDNSPRDVQIDVFSRQLHAARSCNLPIIIHTREAETETIQRLKADYGSSPKTGVFHCFTGTQWLVDEALELGFMISFSGIVTFKKAEELRAVARRVPLDRLLIETDCPYLAPVPHRGKRNEPAYVVEVARCLAEMRGIAIEELGGVTTENFRRCFEI